jgi:hypothetical protein
MTIVGSGRYNGTPIATQSQTWTEPGFTDAPGQGCFAYPGPLIINAAPEPPTPTLTNGLVAYYPFNGNANDASGYGNNLTANGASLSTNRAGQVNASYSFNNNTMTGTVTNCPLGGSSRTLSVWVNTKDSGDSGGNVVSWGSDLGAQRFGICVRGSSPYFVGFISDLQGTMFVSDGKWHQIVTTYTNGTLTLYADGKVDSSAAFNLSTTGNQLVLGANVAGPDSFYLGLADDVRIYNRALSSNEVSQLYVFESSGPCLPHGATATATLAFGFVVNATITDAGCGYSNPPAVLIQGGGGTGAGAVATVANGQVTSITVTNAGFGYTSPPNIYISYPITINQQPQPLAVNAYDTASFSVGASGGASPLGYQWTLDGTNLPGQTSNSITITNVTQSDLGDYAVAVSDIFTTNYSSIATLSMYPFILTPFTGAVTYWGTNISFEVDAWGTGPLTYQWYDNGIAVVAATNNTLNFTNIQFTDAGLYTVVVGGALGSVTNTPASIVVNPAGVSIGLSPRITISGVVGVSYAIQRTTNLSDTNSWTTVTDLTLTQPVEVWVDTNIDTTVPSNPHNFYRVLPGQ